ncbi:hypothetical protein GCM10025762_10560 [Haloechinothrix salitolerans]
MNTILPIGTDPRRRSAVAGGSSRSRFGSLCMLIPVVVPGNADIATSRDDSSILSYRGAVLGQKVTC